MSAWYVYGLSAGPDEPIRYVGSTSNLRKRYHQHYSRPQTAKLQEWIRSLALPPHLAVISEEDSESEAFLVEQREIASRENLLNERGVSVSRVEKPNQFPGFGPRVRRLRMEKGISQRALARACGVYCRTIQLLEESETADTGARNAVHIARLLGTTVEALVTGEAPNV